MSRHFDPGDVPPRIAAAYMSAVRAADDLGSLTAGARRARAHPIAVDEPYLWQIAGQPGASRQLRDFAERVRSGGARWPDVVLGSDVPPEITMMRRSANFEWELPEPTPEAGRPTQRGFLR